MLNFSIEITPHEAFHIARERLSRGSVLASRRGLMLKLDLLKELEVIHVRVKENSSTISTTN